jgi:hypothetical protein
MTADAERDDESAVDRVDAVEPTVAIARVDAPRTPLGRALEAIEDLVADAVRSEARTRFAAAQRICRVGQELLRATAEGVADHVDDAVHGAVDVNFNNAVMPYMGVARGDAHQNAIDQIGALREIMEPIKAQSTASATRDAARARADRAGELVDLQRALELARPEHEAPIRARIDALLAEMGGGDARATTTKATTTTNEPGDEGERDRR